MNFEKSSFSGMKDPVSRLERRVRKTGEIECGRQQLSQEFWK